MKPIPTLAALIALLSSCHGLEAAATVDPVTRIDLDVGTRGWIISPLLFSHNLEVTRRAVWTGLGAEMVANRKFAAVDKDLPKRWTVSGEPVKASIDSQVRYVGTHSLRVEVGSRNPGGIAQQQDSLAFEMGHRYSFRLWLKSAGQQTVSLRIGGGAAALRASPRRTARLWMPSASSQLRRKICPAPLKEHSKSTAMASRSNDRVKRLDFSAQGTGTIWVRPSGHCGCEQRRRGPRAVSRVRHGQVSRCRQVRSSHPGTCSRCAQAGQAQTSPSAQATVTVISWAGQFIFTAVTRQGAHSPSSSS